MIFKGACFEICFITPAIAKHPTLLASFHDGWKRELYVQTARRQKKSNELATKDADTSDPSGHFYSVVPGQISLGPSAF